MMEKKKVFVTLFPLTSNIQLIKDVGMIPFLMYKNHNYNAFVATYNNDSYNYLENDLRGLQLDIFPNTGSSFKDSLKYILKRGKYIDVLQIFGFSLPNLFLIWVFKMISGNNKKAYIKLDANETILQIKYSGIKKYLMSFLVPKVDLISAETLNIANDLTRQNVFGKKVQYIPNGFYDNGIKSRIEFNEKKNRFITVARLSDKIKAVPVLLEGFAKFHIENPEFKDWDFQLVGPFDKEFEEYISEFFKKYPELIDKIILTGAVYDREELRKLYLQSKIFLFASQSESFGFVYLEALQNGCYVITTPLNPATDLTANWKFGTFFNFNDAEDLSKKIFQVLKSINLEQKSYKGSAFVYSEFYWEKIVAKIETMLK